MKIDTVYVPAGKYVIGDPCYTVPNDDWETLLQSCDYFNRPVGISGGFEVLAFPTQYGDGVYRDQDQMIEKMWDRQRVTDGDVLGEGGMRREVAGIDHPTNDRREAPRGGDRSNQRAGQCRERHP